MNKENLKIEANITIDIVSRMSKNDYLNLDSIEKFAWRRIEDVVEVLKGKN